MTHRVMNRTTFVDGTVAVHASDPMSREYAERTVEMATPSAVNALSVIAEEEWERFDPTGLSSLTVGGAP